MYTLRNILVVALSSAVIGLGVWYFGFFRNRNVAFLPESSNTAQEQIDIVDEEPIIIPEWYAYDKDGDGIPDTKETELGTSMWDPDSDFDGLMDDLEINTYKTDPTNPDSDGDGFWDGLEVISGYNPLE
ncbi:MAG: hypothetical protein HYV41_05560 [Candidatus Magasanikbacteria bacterium]|nr:hypothetical protein [Candidatus Magasanikbacteria bacterium]